MDETFSSIELITECLSDPARTSALIKAIERRVKKGDVVLDCGTGSAILALAAARAGASRVIALEFDPYVAQLAQENMRQNGFENVIEIILTDARTVNFPSNTHFDVVIMEMLTAGMVDEHQVWAINNLHQKGVIDAHTTFIPARQDTYIALSQKDFTTEGFTMRMVRHQWSWLPDERPLFLSEKQLLSSVSFATQNDIRFRSTIGLPVTHSGTVNSVHLSSITTFDDEVSIGDTLTLNAPVVFPLETDIPVNKGDMLRLEIQYTFGNGYRNLTVKPV